VSTWPGTLGVVLAGGLARRMGGGDKGLREIGGRPLLAGVIERLAPQCEGLIFSANGDPTRLAEWRLPVVPDGIPGFAGPLAGILAGLDWAAENTSLAWVATAAADTPFLPTDFVQRLHEARERSGRPLASGERALGGGAAGRPSACASGRRRAQGRALDGRARRGVRRMAGRRDGSVLQREHARGPGAGAQVGVRASPYDSSE